MRQITRDDEALILVDVGVQDEEFFYAYYRLQEAGYTVNVVVPDVCQVVHGKYGIPISGTHSFKSLGSFVNTRVVIIPGGWQCPERLRMNPLILDYIRSVWDSVVIGAICHGPWVIASAGVIKNRTLTCYAGIADDVKNAGAKYVEAAVVVDGLLVTAPHYRNNPDFLRAILNLDQSRLV